MQRFRDFVGPAHPLKRRFRAACLLVWTLTGLGLVSVPLEAVESCAMACSLDGGFCCCKLFGVRTSTVEGDELIGRPQIRQPGRSCPDAVVGSSLTPHLGIAEVLGSSVRPADLGLLEVQLRVERPGSTLSLAELPRPPPVLDPSL